MPKLAIMTGKLQGQKMALPEKEVLIGRDDCCQIRLTGTEISRKHCRLRVVGEKVYAVDLGSRNGSYVNDVLISEELLLNHGDLLRVGTMVFKVELTVPKVEPRAPIQKANVEASKPAKSKSPAYDGMVDVHVASDDSIVNWLVEDAPQGGSGDSTIVARTADTSTIKAVVTPTSISASAGISKPVKKLFGSVKEEAADIIKRHLESQTS